MRVGAEARVDPVDITGLISVASELVEGWGRLQFDDGAVVVGSGDQRRQGLRLLDGVHPRAGARYRVMVVDQVLPELSGAERAELAKLGKRRRQRDTAIADWAARRRAEVEASGRMETKTTTVMAEVLANDIETLRVRLVFTDNAHMSVEVTLVGPGSPRTVSVAFDGRIGGASPARGRVVGDGALAVDRLPPAASPDPQVRLVVHHPRARGTATIQVEHTAEGRWRAVVKVRARGAGLARPLVAIASPWLAVVTRRILRASAAALPQQVQGFNRRVHAELAQHGPRGVAEDLLDAFLQALAP